MNSLKDEIINLKEIVIRNLQDENEKLQHKWEWLLEKRCSKYESDHNALAQYGWWNNVVLSGIPESVSEDVLEESVVSNLADIDVLVESQDIEACHRFGKPDRDNSQKTILDFVNRKTVRKFYLTRKNLAVLITANTILCKTQKFLQIRICHPRMSQLPTTAESWSAVVSFMVASQEMAFSQSNVRRKIDLWRFSIWISFMGFFLTLILEMQIMRMVYFLMPCK